MVISIKGVKLGSPAFTWTDYSNPSEGELTNLSKKYGIYRDDLSACLDKNEKARIINRGSYSVIIFLSPTEEKPITYPVGMIISKKNNCVISVHRYRVGGLRKISKNFDSVKKAVRGMSDLVYLILFNITKDFSYDLEDIEDKIEKIENKVFRGGHVEQEIFSMKKKLLYYRRASLNDRDVVTGIENKYIPFIKDNFDKIITEINENLSLEEISRARLVECLEVNLSNVSNKLNEAMKILTVLASLLLFPMLVSGIYGMNFSVLPLRDHPYGFWIMLMIMAIGSLLLLLFFKRKSMI